MCTSSWRATANPRRSGSSSKPGAPAGSRRCSRNVSVHSPHMIPRPRRFARNGGLSVEAHSMSTTRKALRPSSTTYARHKIMQINLNLTSERGASRDAVNRPRETLGDSHLISSDPRSRFGLVCDLLCCRGNIDGIGSGKTSPLRSRSCHQKETTFQRRSQDSGIPVVSSVGRDRAEGLCQPPGHVPPREVGGTPVNPNRRIKRPCGATEPHFAGRVSLDSSRACS